MDISVIIPSFNMLENVKLCSLSISDQVGPSLEQIIVDGGSTDGSVEWLSSQSQITSIVDPVRSMFDAVNKGLDRKSTRRGPY